MRDNHYVMTKFVKIVERYPEIYDRTLVAHKTRHTDPAWEKVAECVRNEIKEECTVDELKVKWKGIRSSYSRYRNKRYAVIDDYVCKKYYLYDALKFLEPHTICKGTPPQTENNGTLDGSCNFVNVGETDVSNDYNILNDWSQSDVKPDITSSQDKNLVTDTLEKTSDTEESSDCDRGKKRKLSNYDKGIDEDDEDLYFFKSVLSDIKDFTKKEKRKLKIGLLQLIDDLESQRQKPSKSTYDD